MSLLKKLVRGLAGRSARRTWTPDELHERLRRGDLDGVEASIDRLTPDTPRREVSTLCLRGEVAFLRKQDSDAERLFREALAVAPGSADAHCGLSKLLQVRGDAEAAVRHAQFAVNTGGGSARFEAQLGLCQVLLGNYVQAERALLRATLLDPNDKFAWNNLGIAARGRGDRDRARGAFQQALALDPSFGQASENLQILSDEPTLPTSTQKENVGLVSPAFAPIRQLVATGEIAKAIDACERLLAERPDDGSAAIELYRLYRVAGDSQSGIDVLQAFHAQHPDELDVLTELGCALVRAQEHKAAKPLVTEALERRPDHTGLLVAMSEIRCEQFRYAEALDLARRAYEIEPTLDHKCLVANRHVEVFNYEKAVQLFDEIQAEDRSAAQSLEGVRVYSLMYLGRHDEALHIVDEAIDQSPNEPVRRFPRATIYLQNERYGEGWDDYAYRQLASSPHMRMLPFPEWRGEPLEGRSILVLAEQGLGDQVMFASCLPDLLRRAPARVVVEAVDRVAPTLARSFPGCEVIATKQDNAFSWVPGLGALDFFVQMGDLPRHFRRSRADFPTHHGYLLPDQRRSAHWAAALAALGPAGRPRIGVSWRGGTMVTRQGVRTMDAIMLAPLMASHDATWVCLQYGDVQADLQKAAEAGTPLHHWPEAIRDLDEFAALISTLDLVITVCNTTVHYAGALDRPVWVMSPKVPEWRYGLNFEVMPWYPSTRMFRQADAGDWVELLNRIGRELSAWCADFPKPLAAGRAILHEPKETG